MSFRIDYEIESHPAILVDPTNQCEINYEGFGEEVAKLDQIEIVHEGKEQNELIPWQTHDKAKQTQIDSFTCKTCDKVFTLKCNLKTHIAAVHDGKKPYKCDICDLKFATNGNKNRHMAAGINAHKTFKEIICKKICKICDKPFPSNAQLKNHIEVDHKGKEPFLCNSCDTKFATKQNKDMHLLRAHNIIVWKEKNCGNCDATFKFQHQLDSS